MPNHTLAVVSESSYRGKDKPHRVAFKLHVRGAKGGTHAILLTSAYYDAGDRRLPFVKTAMDSAAKQLAPWADHLCSCPPPQ